jgi:PKD repeat protein
LHVDFYPYDTVNYIDASEDVTIKVLSACKGCTKPQTDPDHDGCYEDINGNGILDFDDVVKLYDMI